MMNAPQDANRHLTKRVAMLREVACRLLTEHERLTSESRTIAIQLLPTPPPQVVPLR